MARAAAAPATAATPKRKRLSTWQAKELEELESKLPALDAELATLDAQIADPALYVGPAADRERILARRTKLTVESERLYARWAELESLRSGEPGKA